MLEYDIVIAGTGVVGLALACALQSSNWRVGLLDTSPVHSQQSSANKPSDHRWMGLSYGSMQFLQRIGLGDALTAQASPIQQVRVSEMGRWGQTRFHHQDLQLPALGYVVSLAALHQIMQAFLNLKTEQANIEKLNIEKPVEIVRLTPLADRIECHYRQADATQPVQSCRTRLLIAADGAGSTLRQLAGITSQVIDYQQSALVSTVRTAQPHQQIAYERFIPGGAMALLPLAQPHESALVWVLPQTQVQALILATAAQQAQCLQAHLGHRLGAMQLLAPLQAFPLQQVKPRQITQGRMIWIGNAAHVLHPVAAQGLNLGLRDVEVLVDLLQGTSRVALGEPDWVLIYQQQRQGDQRRTAAFTHTLVRIFGTDFMPVRWGRSWGLSLLEGLPVLKNQLGRQLMGLVPYA